RHRQYRAEKVIIKVVEYVPALPGWALCVFFLTLFALLALSCYFSKRVHAGKKILYGYLGQARDGVVATGTRLRLAAAGRRAAAGHFQQAHDIEQDINPNDYNANTGFGL
ncbi:hypothetical protein PFISCL1PPCAC_19127, partial [Pristionchus fissidentatus]